MANRTIGTEIKLTGEKEFNQQMKAINNGLKTTKSDMAALASEFDSNGASIKDLVAKQKLLESSVDQHKAKVSALTNQYEAAAAAYGENSAMAQKYKQQLNQATVALNKETAALEKNADAMKDKLTAGIKAAAASTKNILSGVGTAAGTAAKGVGAVVKAASAGVAALSAAGTAVLGIMASMADEAIEAAKAAQESGSELTASQQQWIDFSGQMDSVKSSVANAKGALAGVLLPILSDLSTEGAAFLNDFTRDMTAAAGDTEKQTKVLSDYIVKGATLIMEKLPEYIEAGKALFAGIGEGLSESGPELLDMGLDLAMDLLDQIIRYAPNLAKAGIKLVQKLVEGLKKRGPDVLASAVQMVAQITTGLAQAAPSLIPAAVDLVIQLVTALIENAPLLVEAGLELVVGIVTGLIRALPSIASAADSLIDTFVDRMASSDSKILQLGANVVAKIRKGIADAWLELVKWFNQLWDGLFSNRDVDVGVQYGSAGPSPDGSHASGLGYVPFDGYLARLHRGEAVLTAEEAAAYRRGNSGQILKQFNLTIHAPSLSKEDLDMIVSYVNRKLGDECA